MCLKNSIIRMALSVQEPGSLLITSLLGAAFLLFLYVLYYTTSLYSRAVEGVKVPRGNFWLFPLLGESLSALSVPPKQFINKQTKKWLREELLGSMESSLEGLFGNCVNLGLATNKENMYGATFTTHIGGDPTIMTTDMELTKWVYQQTNKLFSVASPRATYDLLGKESIFFVGGDHHLRLRKLVAGSLSTPKLIAFTPRIDIMASDLMVSWKEKRRVVVFDEVKKYVLYLAWVHLITIDTQEYPFLNDMLAGVPGDTQLEKLVELHYDIEYGMMSVPLYIPGTAYYKAMNARRRIVKILMKIVADRRNGTVRCNDFLQGLLSPMDDGSLLRDDQVVDNMITTLGAAEATNTTAIVWMIKYIFEHPELHKDLQVELDAIRSSKVEGEQLSYENIKNMNLTLWTMYETLRMCKVTGFFTGRHAHKDVRFKDVVIPQNWKVALTHGYHFDPNYYPEPEKFNPYRFQTMPPANTFTPFGASIRTCPGKEMAKIEILTFIYHMLTSYSWEPAEPDKGIIWHLFPHPRNKLPIKVTPRGVSD